MKSSTKKIMGTLVLTPILELATLLVPSPVLRNYLQVAVLAGAIFASVILMGWAKMRGRQNKIVATLIILAAAVFQFATFLLLGLKLGWIHNVYRWNLTNIFQVFLPVALVIVAAEILRGQLVERGKGSLATVITVGVVIWLTQIIIALPQYNLADGKAIFNLIVLVAGPALINNILFTYIAYAYDYRINVAYRLIMEMPVYLLPILPDGGVYLPVLFQIGLVFVLALSLAGVHKANQRNMAVSSRRKAVKRIESDQKKRFKRAMRWVGVGVVVAVVVVYAGLMSGLFRYHFLAIGSGSMEPNLYRGDMVLVEKSKEYDEMTEGDILVYRHSNVVMVHRISEVRKVGNNYVFHTKGDNNPSEDVWEVEQGDVIGIARGKIAMFGYPTLWLNELFNGES